MGNLDLKCVLLNAENLFLLFDKPLPENYKNLNEHEWKLLSSSVYPNKPLKKVLDLALIIEELDPDIVLLAEVGGEESLKNWNQHFLDSKYYPALIEGNSNRSIDVGFLIHKRCQFYFNIETNKNRTLDFLYAHEKKLASASTITHKLSRDVAELHLFEQTKEKPFFVFLLTHLKSPLDPAGIDSNGSARREAEVQTLIAIYKQHQNKLGAVPIAVCGDFNGNASRHNTEKEFTEIYKQTDLDDTFEIANLDSELRNTFYHVRNSGKTEGRQIDFCFLSPGAQKLLKVDSAQVYKYKNDLNQRPKCPKSLLEKESLPSDHYPICFILNGL